MGQSPSQHEQNLDLYYQGGAKAFLSKVYMGIRYPRKARLDCVIGHLKVEVTISEEGEVEEVDLKNSLGASINKEVIRVLKKTSGKWKKGNRVTLPMSFGFRIGDFYSDCKADIIVTEFGGSLSQNCDTKSDLDKWLTQAIKKKKIKRAIGLCDKLLLRYPDDPKYQAMRLGLLKSEKFE